MDLFYIKISEGFLSGFIGFNGSRLFTNKYLYKTKKPRILV
jgi:hypothetical protein